MDETDETDESHMFRIGRKVFRRFQCPNSLKSTQEESSGLQAPWPLIGFHWWVALEGQWKAHVYPVSWNMASWRIPARSAVDSWENHQTKWRLFQQAMFDYWRVDRSCFPCSNSQELTSLLRIPQEQSADFFVDSLLEMWRFMYLYVYIYILYTYIYIYILYYIYYI